MSSINPPAVDMLYAVGRWLLDEERAVDAIHVFRTMVTTAPHDERSWLGLATSHERIGHHQAALELYELGETTVATSFRCSLARARLLRQLDEEQHQVAYERAEDRARLIDDVIADAIAQERAAA